MLVELDIANLAVIDHARIAFGPGLNVLTGETGAGKSIVVDALTLLVGGRGDAGMIRAGAESARVEGLFEAGTLDLAALAEAGIAVGEDGAVILARELTTSGRTVCRINGRAMPLRLLQEVGEQLVDIHGQSAHLSLLRPVEQVELLDRWAGLAERRLEVAARRTRLRRLRREAADLAGDQRELARRADLLRHQIGEIDAARLRPGEDDELRATQRLQASAEQLLALAASAYAALGGGGDDVATARDTLAAAAQALEQVAVIDGAARPLVEAATAAALQVDELVASVRAYRDGLDVDPAALAATDDRLGVIFGLKRKYGATVDEVLGFADGARAELDGLAGHEQQAAALAREAAAVEVALGEAASELDRLRRQAASSLETSALQHLGSLGMAGEFRVAIGVAEEMGDLAPVEFLLSLNPGEPARPLAKVASGGETSRVMLALKAALAGADPHPTLVFDEIDSGIGGRVAEVVAGKLAALAGHSQVLVVTHLPQIAAYGDRHLHVAKHVDGGRTITRVTPLEGEARLDELSDMFGSDRTAGRQQAAAVRERAQALGRR